MFRLAVVVNCGRFNHAGNLFLAIEVDVFGKLTILEDMYLSSISTNPCPGIFSGWNLFNVVGSFLAGMICYSLHVLITFQSLGISSSCLNPSDIIAGPNHG